jgi:hypothetical protein
MGIHNLAPVFSVLKLGAPESVHSSSTLVYEETLPLASAVHYQFGAREGMPPVKLHWYDGGMLPARPDELEETRELSAEDGLIFVGDKVKMYVEAGAATVRLFRSEEKLQAAAKTLPRSIGHHPNGSRPVRRAARHVQFRLCRPGPRRFCRNGFHSMGGKMDWDSENFKITNLPEANKYLHYEYRSGWTL